MTSLLLLLTAQINSSYWIDAQFNDPGRQHMLALEREGRLHQPFDFVFGVSPYLDESVLDRRAQRMKLVIRNSAQLAPLLETLRKALRAVYPKSRLLQQPNVLPDSYDEREHVQGIHPLDQRPMPYCWAFADCAAIDISYAHLYGEQVSTSEQQLAHCSISTALNPKSGEIVAALKWVKEIGLWSSNKVKFVPIPLDPNIKGQVCLVNGPYRLSDYGLVALDPNKPKANPTDIKAAVMKYGCVVSAVYVDAKFGNWRPGGLPFRDTSYIWTGAVNHAVDIIGWKPYKLGNKTREAWLIRNSWGSSWGDRGFMWIDFDTDNIGVDASFCVPTPSAEGSPRQKSIFQNFMNRLRPVDKNLLFAK